MRFLLDTNVVSNLIRDPQGRIAERIKIVGEQEICTSIIVAAELRFEATKKASPTVDGAGRSSSRRDRHIAF